MQEPAEGPGHRRRQSHLSLGRYQDCMEVDSDEEVEPEAKKRRSISKGRRAGQRGAEVLTLDTLSGEGGHVLDEVSFTDLEDHEDEHEEVLALPLTHTHTYIYIYIYTSIHVIFYDIDTCHIV